MSSNFILSYLSLFTRVFTKVFTASNSSQVTNPFLPQDLIIEIFSRMPQKSICRCKCLSKSWLSLLSKPSFLNHCLTHYGNLLLIDPSHSLNLLLSTPMINNNAISRKLKVPGSWTQVIGFCNGFALLTNKESELYLVNTVTSIAVKIPDSETALKKTESIISHGFGYDASTNDYKIVTLSYRQIELFLYPDKMQVEVYSVKKGAWKRTDFPYNSFIGEDNPDVCGVFVNGAVHWQVVSTMGKYILYRDPCIVAFDLASEVFCEIVPPLIADLFFEKLVVREGRLCAVCPDYNPGGGGNVWTMEEYGSDESWKRFSIPENEDLPRMRAWCFVGEERVVMRGMDGRLFVYDVKEGTMKAFVVDGIAASCIDLVGAVDSLV